MGGCGAVGHSTGRPTGGGTRPPPALPPCRYMGPNLRYQLAHDAKWAQVPLVNTVGAHRHHGPWSHYHMHKRTSSREHNRLLRARPQERACQSATGQSSRLLARVVRQSRHHVLVHRRLQGGVQVGQLVLLPCQRMLKLVSALRRPIPRGRALELRGRRRHGRQLQLLRSSWHLRIQSRTLAGGGCDKSRGDLGLC
eukprot:scaffold123777_cov54-Phaeocystis_antarctica.AAC.1